MNTTTKTTTAPVTIGRDTRTIEITYYVDETNRAAGAAMHTTANSVVAVIGRGAARYPSTLLLNPAAPGPKAIVAADGTTWRRSTTAHARNRTAEIVGWADTTGATNTQDQTRVA